MKLAKTLLAILLAALLACSMFAVGASAEDDDALVDAAAEEQVVLPAPADPIPANLPWFLNTLQSITGIDLADMFDSIQELFDFLEDFLNDGFDVAWLEDMLNGDASIFDLFRAFDLGSLIGELGGDFSIGGFDLSNLLGLLNFGNFDFSKLFGFLDFSKFFNGDFFGGIGGFFSGIGARIQGFFNSFLRFFCNCSLFGTIMRWLGIDVSIIINIPG